MENLELLEVVEEIVDALDNEVPYGIIIQWVNESPLSDKEADNLVALLEDKGCLIMASKIADEIHSPTLSDDLQRQRDWWENDVCNGLPKPRKEWDKKWLKLYTTLYSDNPEGGELIWARTDCRSWHNDI